MTRKFHNMIVSLLFELFLILGSKTQSGYALSMDYYARSCPYAEMVVRNCVFRALTQDPSLSGPLLRMHFHDCFVQGCDGSVLIDSKKKNKAEKDSPANLSLRGFEIIDDIKQEIEKQCPGVVSCADILTMIARDAVIFAGGPFYDVLTGRKDGKRSKIEDTFKLPPPTMNSSDLIQLFRQRGFSAQELVALSGAHTLGVARCSSFKDRLQNANNPSMDSAMAAALVQTCNAGDDTEVELDQTKTTFDNAYYNALKMGTGLLSSDQTLMDNFQTSDVVNAYAMNERMFFFDFQMAMMKLGKLDVKENEEGEVRLNCRKVNS